ncbi:phage head closure protein [Paracidovorax wautersii]|uniref:SPP1 family predicted phage head-tail adaptor n=1 Tax=Paracidovorax wautersii TaxID=1177982 RepID=A0ABU1IIS2_9BURK|nr:phage head closure protein [Paracidovorax wautersii]MDR6216174.1 SPP1 family predicted phage head-tail adaptor [Paracidovorax wautersii]
MTLDAGDLNRRITIQRKGAGTDDWGTPLPDAWDDVTKAWASIRNLSGLGAIKADAEASIVKTSIRIRYRTDIAAGMRVLHGGVNYSIVAVLPDAAGREHLDLVCEVVT